MVQPLPEVTELTRAFWEGGARGELRIMRCLTCGRWFHPPAPVCPMCLSSDVAAEPVSGRATVAAFTINHQQWAPGLPVPYVVAIVELDEQTDVRLTTRLVGCEPDAVHIGQRVEVVFEHVEDVWLPLFQPIDSGQEAVGA
jgi:uncharacterized OB-fold protein